MMKKLLLADDSITIQKVVGIIFATEDYQLLVTDDGDSALQKALEEVPDLVIADISMPGKNGYELCAAIKNEPKLAGTSVLLLPGAFEHFDEAKAQEVNADGWLTKPFESQALLDKVAQLLEAAPLRKESSAAGEDVADQAASAESGIDDAVLGLDAADELEPEPLADEDDSSDDIWDAVSFEEEDLGEEDASTVTSAVDLAFAAEDLSDDMAVEEDLPAGAAEEESFSPPAQPDLPEEDVFESEEPSPVVEEEPALISPDVDDSDVFAESADIGFSIDREEEPEFVESPEETEDNDGTYDFGGTEETFELSEDDVVSELTDVTEEDTVEEDFILSDEPAEELEEEIYDLGKTPEDEVLDLSEEEILDEEEFEPLATDSGDADESFFEPPEDVEEGEEDDSETLTADLESGRAEEIFVADLSENEEDSGEEDSETAMAEDDGFYFDAAAEEKAGGQSGGSSLEEAERQLQQLSEEELKEVVGKVAGPIIEKLANELLEQIAWEVVPDLAESLIREEIRKIQQVED